MPRSITPSFSDVSYTEARPVATKGNLIDVHRPAAPADEPAPAIFWTSGSAWLADDGKHGADAIAAEFVPRGYAVVGVSIRSSRQRRFPGQLHDVRAAVRFVRSNASRFGIDPDRLAYMGNSSGGWAAAMAAATSATMRLDSEPAVGGVSSAVGAAVSFFPPVEFLAMDRQTTAQMAEYGIAGPTVIVHDDPTSPESQLVGGPIQDHPELAAAASPLAFVDGSEPPVAIFHGTHDPLLPPGQSEDLYRALRDAGSQVTLTLVDGAGHLLTAPEPGTPPHPYNLGRPVLNADRFSMRSATGGVETSGTGTAPTWDAIDAYIRDALDNG